KSFCANKHMKKSTVRTISEITVEKHMDEVRIIYRGNGFLYHMVRIMTGTLIEVGLGKREPEEVCKILEMKDRKAAGFLAPAQGLCLEQVRYDENQVRKIKNGGKAWNI
nr:hypothetical protein [Acetatifactor sp.]